MEDKLCGSISDRELWDVWLNQFSCPLLAAADDLRLFDFFCDHPSATVENLSQSLKISLNAACTLVSFLCAEGFLSAVQPAGYLVTEKACRFLNRQSPYYWGGMFEGWRGYDLYAEIRSVLVGESQRKSHSNRWRQNGIEDSNSEIFLRAMQSQSLCSAKALVASAILNGSKGLLDVGGGSGCYAAEAKSKLPELNVAIVELPSVVPFTRKFLDKSGARNIEVVPCDMFADELPSGYDTALLSDIVHDWDFDTGLNLLRKVHRSLAPGGRVIIHEMLMSENFDGPREAALFSLVMLMRTEGRQYKFSELKNMLETAGFRQIAKNAGLHYYHFIEGSKL